MSPSLMFYLKKKDLYIYGVVVMHLCVHMEARSGCWVLYSIRLHLFL